MRSALINAALFHREYATNGAASPVGPDNPLSYNMPPRAAVLTPVAFAKIAHEYPQLESPATMLIRYVPAVGYVAPVPAVVPCRYCASVAVGATVADGAPPVNF